MGKLTDITGRRFNRLLVIERSYTDKDNFILWKCLCDCGNVVLERSYPIRTGEIKSCGCLNQELRLKRVTKHGLSKLPIYMVYKSMKRRCYSPKDKRFNRYGGRGISVCDEWIKNSVAFIKWAFNNGYKEGLSLDRIDNNKNYSPDNCRFISVAENNRNSSSTHLKQPDVIKIRSLYSDGKLQTDIARLFQISQQTVSKIVNHKSWQI